MGILGNCAETYWKDHGDIGHSLRSDGLIFRIDRMVE